MSSKTRTNITQSKFIVNRNCRKFLLKHNPHIRADYYIITKCNIEFPDIPQYKPLCSVCFNKNTMIAENFTIKNECRNMDNNSWTKIKDLPGYCMKCGTNLLFFVQRGFCNLCD